MFRFARTLILTMVFSALTAAALLLWLSPDPMYLTQEWLAQGRYYEFDGAIREVAEKRGIEPDKTGRHVSDHDSPNGCDNHV